jgi:hypothetical protein
MDSNISYYSPSIIDRLLDWINRQGFPAWLIYLFLYLLFLLINQGSAWLDGSAAIGQFEILKITVSIWPILTLAIINYLDRLAITASEVFRPLWADNDEEYNQKVFQLTHMPARPVWVLIGLGPTMVILSYTLDLGIVNFTDQTAWSLVSELIINTIGFPLFPIFAYHTFRQLSIVYQIHSNLGEIDLFNSTPLYAFSVLTSRTGIAWVILLSTTVLFLLFSSTTYGGSTPAMLIFFASTEVLLAIASFILPLLGLHAQMEKAKCTLIDEINVHMKTSISQMGSAFIKLDPETASAKRDLVETLKAQQSYISELPTWPWKTDTFRGFLSVIFLPILITVIQQLIEKLF